MRLTLRTLLAFLDGVLEDPTQSRELAGKIEESKFAGELVQRIRNVVHRSRLGAPPVTGSGPNDDPNVVAEYLQSSLPHEQVTEFEKACLDSDVQLAEVAACHQILCELRTDREALKIEPRLRERLYRLPLTIPPQTPDSKSPQPLQQAGGNTHQGQPQDKGPNARPTANGRSAHHGSNADSSAASEGGTATSLDLRSDATDDQRQNFHVNLLDGLQESGVGISAPYEPKSAGPEAAPRKRTGVKAGKKPSGSQLPWKSIATTGILGFVVAVVAMRALGEFNTNHLILRWFTGKPAARDLAAADQTKQSEKGSQNAAAGLADRSATETKPGSSAADSAAAGGVDRSTKATTMRPAEPAGGTGQAAEQVDPTAEASPAAGGAAGAAAEIGPPSEPRQGAPGSAPATTPASATTASGVTTDPRTSAGVGLAASNPAAAPTPAAGSAATMTKDRPPTRPDPTAAELSTEEVTLSEGMPVGRYSSESQVLARWQSLATTAPSAASAAETAAEDHGETEGGRTWLPLPQDATLSAGDLLLSLPSYRPQLVLSPGVKLTLVHETLLRLLPSVGETTPRIELRRGRAIVLPVVMSPVSVRCVIGSQEGTLAFSNLESAAAVEVRHVLPIGSDPETTPSQVLVTLTCTQGQITWKADADPPLVLDAGTQVTAIDRTPFSLVESSSLPAWIDQPTDAEIELRASNELRKALVPGRPLALSLLEKTSFRQQEVVDLASRALAVMDSPKELIQQLSDHRQSSFWASQVATLQQLVARSPQSARNVRLAFEELHGELAPILYRLTWGFSAEQLAGSGASDLVTYLQSNEMALRVLAFKTLEQITGLNHLYRPELTPDQEKTKIARWQRALAEGRIVYRDSP